MDGVFVVVVVIIVFLLDVLYASVLLVIVVFSDAPISIIIFFDFHAWGPLVVAPFVVDVFLDAPFRFVVFLDFLYDDDALGVGDAMFVLEMLDDHLLPPGGHRASVALVADELRVKGVDVIVELTGVDETLSAVSALLGHGRRRILFRLDALAFDVDEFDVGRQDGFDAVLETQMMVEELSPSTC